MPRLRGYHRTGTAESIRQLLSAAPADGLTQQELASRLGVTQVAVSWHLQRLREKRTPGWTVTKRRPHPHAGRPVCYYRIDPDHAAVSAG